VKDAETHFDEVLSLLNALKVPHTLNPNLVPGLIIQQDDL
jgi:hypothetical protein